MEQHVQQACHTDFKAALEAYIGVGEHWDWHLRRYAVGLEIVQKIQEKKISFFQKLNDDNRLTVVIFFATPLSWPSKSIDAILIILNTDFKTKLPFVN